MPAPGPTLSRTHKTPLLLMMVALFPGIAQAAHPLITEDTGTQGNGRFQLELTTEHGYEDEVYTNRHTRTSTVTLSYGAHDNLDAIVTLPFQHAGSETNGDIDTHNGLSDAGFDIKWRFLEKDILSLAFKPGVTFPTGDEAVGLGSGKSGYSLYFITSYEPAPWALHLHFGYRRHRNIADERQNIRHISLGGWREFGKELKIVGDVGTSTSTDKSSNTDPAFAILGLIYSPRENIDLDFGVKRGVTGPETDYTLLGGVTLRF